MIQESTIPTRTATRAKPVILFADDLVVED